MAVHDNSVYMFSHMFSDSSVAASCYLLSWFQTVLIPFFLAIFLMYVLLLLFDVLLVKLIGIVCFVSSSSSSS